MHSSTSGNLPCRHDLTQCMAERVVAAGKYMITVSDMPCCWALPERTIYRLASLHQEVRKSSADLDTTIVMTLQGKATWLTPPSPLLHVWLCIPAKGSSMDKGRMQSMLREQVSAYLVAGLPQPSTGQDWVEQTELLTGSASPVGLGGLLSPWTRTHLHALLSSLAPGMLSDLQAKAWHHLPRWHQPSATPGPGFRDWALKHIPQSHSATVSSVSWVNAT